MTEFLTKRQLSNYRYYREHIDERKSYNRKYYQEHREWLLRNSSENGKRRYRLHRESILASVKAYSRLHREEESVRGHRRSRKLKEEVLRVYGNGKCTCARCGERRLDCLSIDHIEGNGSKHARTRGGRSFYSWLKHNDYPEDYQILCMNCQFVKRREKGEYRKAGGGSFSQREEAQRARLRMQNREGRIRIRTKVLNYYGNGLACITCGENRFDCLSIDHINGDGARHRASLKGKSLYSWLVKSGFPEGFQVLCMNCQFIKRYENREFRKAKE